MKRVLALAMLASVTGCCGTGSKTPVFVETTLARLELPERPSSVIHLSAGMSGSTYYELTPDQNTVPPRPAAARPTDEDPDTSSCGDSGKGLYWRGEVCFGKRLSLGASRRSHGPTMARARLYLAGNDRAHAKAGNFSLALTGAWGRDRSTISSQDSNGGEYRTRLERSETDIGLIMGYRLYKPLMVYGGPYQLRTRFDVEHERPGSAMQHSAGDALATGGHIGIALFAGLHSSWLLEFSRAKVAAGGGDEDVAHGGLSYQLEF
jgi:hypothetical protein